MSRIDSIKRLSTAISRLCTEYGGVGDAQQRASNGQFGSGGGNAGSGAGGQAGSGMNRTTKARMASNAAGNAGASAKSGPKVGHNQPPGPEAPRSTPESRAKLAAAAAKQLAQLRAKNGTS